MKSPRLIVLAAVLLGLAGAPAVASAPSPPSVLATCTPARSPKVVFPASMPGVPSGPGAILWLGGPPTCPARDGAVQRIDIATLSADDTPQPPRAFVTAAGDPVALAAPLQVASTTHGQAVALARARGVASAVYGVAGADDTVALMRRIDGSVGLTATADGFIGDADIAAVVRGARNTRSIVLLEQRHYESSFGAPLSLPAGRGPITALALGMDFRADTVIVWAQGGSVYARAVSNTGVAGARQRLGPSGYRPQISAVLSDDTRAIVTWAAQPPPGSSAPTQIYFDQSASHVAFTAPIVLDSFVQPPGLRLTPGALAIARLSTEGVLDVWTSYLAGSYVVRAAGVTQHGAESTVLASDPTGDERLAAMAAGPRGEAVVVLESAPRVAGGFDGTHQRILVSNSYHAPGGGVAFTAVAQLAAAGPNTAPSVGIDPLSDRAVATWTTVDSGRAAVAYAVRGAS